MLEIKRLGLERVEEIKDFDVFSFPDDHWDDEAWNELLSDERSVYYALLDDDKLVGNIFIYNWEGKKDYIKIMTMAVHPDYRKQGLASRLMKHSEEEMLKFGMKNFRGETRASNKPMQATFERCGYKLDTVEKDYYDNPTEDAYKYILLR